MAKITEDFIDKVLKDLAPQLAMLDTPVKENKEKSDYVGDKLQEVDEFVANNGREPSKDSQVLNEKLLAIRLDSIRKSSVPQSLNDILDDPIMKTILQKDESNSSIFVFDNPLLQRSEERKMKSNPDFIAQHSPCPNFETKYKALFDEVQNALDNGHRKLIQPSEALLCQKGSFHVVRGVIFLIENLDVLKQRPDGSYDGRVLCVYANGTEAPLYFQSVVRAMKRDNGRTLTQDDRVDVSEDLVSTLTKSEEESVPDTLTGYIYVLESLSQEAEILAYHGMLHKIGFTRFTVDSRLRGAENDPTYLCSGVKIVEKWKCLNVKTSKLESMVHRFFSPAQVPIQVRTKKGQLAIAKEWYAVPLEVIEQFVPLFISKKLGDYRYDKVERRIVCRKK